MTQPAYHLRANKAVERLVFVDAIARLKRFASLRDYVYFSLGGPYLDDFRLMYEFFPELKMVSVEIDEEVYKRQIFHQPCGNVTLHHDDLSSFVATNDFERVRSIFWLDNTGLEYSHFETFITLLQKVGSGSMIKITLDASTGRFSGKTEDVKKKIAAFREKYALVLPEAEATPPLDNYGFASLLQKMVRVAAERALPADTELMFQPVSSFYYKDGQAMLTVTGIVCFRHEAEHVRAAFADWQFLNLDWRDPKIIDLPVLTTKERLQLQRYLPCADDPGPTLRNVLGYLTVPDDAARTEQQLAQYAEYHRYSPYFIRAVP
jgi:hypothetical protein